MSQGELRRGPSPEADYSDGLDLLVWIFVGISVWIFGRAGRSSWSKASDKPTAGSCCGPKKLQAGQRPAATTAACAVTVDDVITYPF
jgi:hypothetical protein